MLAKIPGLFIFIIFFLSFIPEPTFLKIEGLVTVDGNPVKAEIEINSVLKNKTFSSRVDADKVQGNFFTKLPSGDEYEIIVKVDHFPQQVISINALHLDSTQVLNVFADFTSPAYDKKLEELIRSNEEKFKSTKLHFNKKNFGMKFGNSKKESLEYKVQIAAYKFYENFNYNNVLGLPRIIRKTDADQITRFTMGNFETYNEALTLLKIVQKNKLKDAFIIAFYKGEKKMLQQLVDENIFHL
jgi:hypothetical protein